MTVYLPPKGQRYRYDFWFRKKRYTGLTAATSKRAALIEERRFRRQLAREAGGLDPVNRLQVDPDAVSAALNLPPPLDPALGDPRAADLETQIRSFIARHPGDKVGYIYFVGDGRCVKIGFAVGLGDRFRALQTSSSQPLTLLAAIAGTVRAERHLHDTFADLHQRGEWFRPEEPLLSLIRTLASKAKADQTLDQSR